MLFGRRTGFKLNIPKNKLKKTLHFIFYMLLSLLMNS